MIETQHNIIDREETLENSLIDNGLSDSASELFEFIKSVIGSDLTKSLQFISVNGQKKTDSLSDTSSGYVCQTRLNDIRYINRFIENINEKLLDGQFIIIKLETKQARAARLFNKYPKLISHPLYFFDFILNRIAPKLTITKKLYFAVTKGKNRVISLPEAMARLFSCGFKVLDDLKIDGHTFIIATKVGSPVYDESPTYGLLVKLRRVGLDGKLITVRKIRTMHPYSEYLQEYLFEKHGTKDGDKIEEDIRVTRWGKFIRKFWIDEIPMLLNWLKRDLKIVGVRPLSRHKFNTYPKYLQEKRIRYKPGLIPPYYADLPQKPEEFFESENRYLDAYDKDPLKTDIRYFFKAIYNIIIRGERSR